MRYDAISYNLKHICNVLGGLVLALALALPALNAPAAASEPQLTLLRPKLAEMRPEESRTMWLIIENTGKIEDRLLSVSSPQFGRARLVTPHSAQNEGLRIPAGEARTLGPSGDAVLVLGAPTTPWLEGQSATVEFAFARSGPITLALRAGPRPSGGLQLTTAVHTVSGADESADEPGETLRQPKPGRPE